MIIPVIFCLVTGWQTRQLLLSADLDSKFYKWTSDCSVRLPATISCTKDTPWGILETWDPEHQRASTRKWREQRALQKVNETIHFEYGRYQVPWPWKEESPSLPTNYELAIGKLRSEVNRLSRNDKYPQKNGAVIQDQVQKGIVEAVPDESHQSSIRYDIHSISVGPRIKNYLRLEPPSLTCR